MDVDRPAPGEELNTGETTTPRQAATAILVRDGAECVDARWIRPADALDARGRGELMLVFPTIKHLEELTGFRSVSEALAAARERVVDPVQPRIVVGDDGERVLLPGEPGYHDR